MGRAILRSLLWGVVAAVAWVVGAFVASGACGYVYGFKGGSFLGSSPPGWKGAEQMAVMMSVFGWVPLSPVAFVIGAVAGWRRKPRSKPPAMEE